jgi:hypothetical protein
MRLGVGVRGTLQRRNASGGKQLTLYVGAEPLCIAAKRVGYANGIERAERVAEMSLAVQGTGAGKYAFRRSGDGEGIFRCHGHALARSHRGHVREPDTHRESTQHHGRSGGNEHQRGEDPRTPDG